MMAIHFKLSLSLINIIILFALTMESVVGQQNFERAEILSDSYFLLYRVDFETKAITFEVSVKTVGYIGFGISSTYSMRGADIVVGGIDDSTGTAYFSDRHGTGSFMPELDEKQDWTLISVSQQEGVTNISFSRNFETCDSLQDLAITDDTLQIIWSIGNTDNFEYHGSNRGAKSINFLDPPSPPLDFSEFQQLIFTVNSSMATTKDTTYGCTAHKMTFDQRVHVVGFETILADPLAIRHVHHLILHKCGGSNIAELMEPFLNSPGGECHDPNDPIHELLSFCNSYIYVWARGGNRLILPEHVGLPIGSSDGGGSDADEYFLLEIHYDNPNVEVGIQFETGVKLYLTTELRSTEAGLLHMGHKVSPALTIPPNVVNFTAVGHCSSDCTAMNLPSEGINLFNIMLHSHLNAKKLKLRHFRDDQELPWIAHDDHYDFNYQQNRVLRTEVTVLPGDHLSYECTYDNTWSEPPLASHGGLSTRHEMCETFILYYPLTPYMDICQSEMSDFPAFLQTLGIDSLDSQDLDMPIITGPPVIAGLTYEQVLTNHVDWTPAFLAEVQQKIRFSAHLGSCSGNTNSHTNFEGLTTYPEISEPYQPPSPNCENPPEPATILECIDLKTDFENYKWNSYPNYLYAEDASSISITTSSLPGSHFLNELTGKGIFYFEGSVGIKLHLLFKDFTASLTNLDEDQSVYIYLKYYSHFVGSNDTQTIYVQPIESCAGDYAKQLPLTKQNLVWKERVFEIQPFNDVVGGLVEIGIHDFGPGDLFLIDKIVVASAPLWTDLWQQIGTCF